MPITTNRNPLSVTTASGSFNQPRYFNQVSWSGLNDNRNIATIDPQSFNSCENVYLDTNNVLCSRPAIKKDLMFDDDVIRFWETSDGKVLEYTTNGYLRLKGSPDTWILVGNEMSLLQIEGRCFIFNNSNCWVYEDGTFTLVNTENIQNYIYVPEVEIYTDGTPATNESKNLATDYVAYTHLRGVNSYVDEFELDGEVVYYQDEDGNDASVTWMANVTNRVLLDYYTKRKFDYLSVATNGSGAIAVDNESLFYTTDGTTWKQLPMPGGRIGYPIITKDGMTCLMVLPSGLYALTLVAAGFEGKAEFPTWTNICKPFLREYEAGESESFLDGNSRAFTSLLGLEAISYDNYVMVATGPKSSKTDNYQTITTVYATNPNFVRINQIDNSENETLYTTMSGKGGSSISRAYNNRADNTNTYTRMPICRTIPDVDTTQDVKIVLKDIVYQNSQMVAIAFKANKLNEELGVGLPTTSTYYNSKQEVISNVHTPYNDIVDSTRVTDSDKVRYAILFLEALIDSGSYKASGHQFRALGDPTTIDGTTDDCKNKYQRECRTYPLTFEGATLDPSTPTLALYGNMGTNTSVRNWGFEFTETPLEVSSMNYKLRFFFPLSAKTNDGGEISLGLVDKTVNIRYGALDSAIEGLPSKPRKNGIDSTFAIGESIITSSKHNFTNMQFRLRAKGSRKIGISAKLKTEGKNKHSSDFNGTCEFLNPNELKLKMDGNTKVTGEASSEAQSDNECILKLGGDQISSDNFSFGEENLISLLRDAVERRMNENPDYKSADKGLLSTSLVYSAMVPSEYDKRVYKVNGKHYKLNFTPFNGVTVEPKSFDYIDKTITVDSKELAIKDYDNKPVTDLGDYYIDCWFYWEGYKVSLEEFNYQSDGDWNIDDKASLIYYGQSSTFGSSENRRIYSNGYMDTLMDIPYCLSAKDFDMSVLSPEFIAVENPTPGIGATFYPTVSKFKDIVYFGNFTLVKDEQGLYKTNQYVVNKSLTYYYKQGKEFNLKVLDGWVENNRRIYGYIGNVIYIEERRYTKDRKPLLYIPQGSIEKRDKLITGLTNFSKGVVGIFHENEIWYMYPSYNDENKLIGYIYSKGRVGLGLTYGGEVETLYDGKTICFGTYRGIVGLQYEALTQNEEQILTYLSDNIPDKYQQFYERSSTGVKIFQYKFWVYFWQQGFKECLVYDIRNGSWWPYSFKSPIANFAKYKDKLYIHTENGWGTPTEENWYLDYDKDTIDWHFQSQELSLGNINYKKRIINITLQSLETDERKFSAILTCKNFRKRAYVSKEQILEYPIDVVRTYVHRLNYLQSVQFQYLLSNDKQRAPKEQTPLSLSAAIIKYEMEEAVR